MIDRKSSQDSYFSEWKIENSVNSIMVPKLSRLYIYIYIYIYIYANGYMVKLLTMQGKWTFQFLWQEDELFGARFFFFWKHPIRIRESEPPVVSSSIISSKWMHG
jgi:hypothetical protein